MTLIAIDCNVSVNVISDELIAYIIILQSAICTNHLGDHPIRIFSLKSNSE
jgi:hypothetical protein